MLAVILAAGKGSRLGEAAGGLPKPLVDVGGLSLIQRQIRNLQSYGVDEFLVVTGHRSDEVRQAVLEQCPNCKFVFNPDFASTNTLHSLHLAMSSIGERDFFYLNADVLFAPSLLSKLDGPGIRLAIETKRCAEEEVKVIVNPSNQRIKAISKKLEPSECLGEFIGIAKFAAEFQPYFAATLAREVELGFGNDYFERALHLLCREHALMPVDITGEIVIEVDFPEDLKKARQMASLI